MAIGIIVLLWGVARSCSQDSRAVEPSKPPAISSAATYAPGDYYVDHVVDGDTLWLRKDGVLTKVRLLRVDAPESNEFGYREATQELERQLGDESSIKLEFEEERADEFGRLLAYVFVEGKNVNVALVRSGWSPYFTRYGRGKYQSDFRQAESEARKEKLGIWANR